MRAIHPILSSTLVSSLFLAACHSNDKPTAAPPVRVEVAVAGSPLTDGFNTAGRTFSGTVQSAESSSLSFKVPGTITSITVDAGSRVSQGQTLGTVRSADLHDNAAIADAALHEARDAYNRMKKLHEAKAIPDMRWVEVQSTLRQAENAAAIAHRAVADATLTAPYAGYISAKLADKGQNVLPAQPVLTLVNLDRMEIAISVPQEEIAAFGNSTRALVTVDSLTLEGELTSRGVEADPLTRAFTVKYAIDNPGRHILPGMTGNVSIEPTAPSDSLSASILLPTQSVLLDSDNRYFVWIVSKGRAERRFVTPGQLSSGGVTITSGLERGDSVVTAGMAKVGTGSQVTVTNR